MDARTPRIIGRDSQSVTNNPPAPWGIVGRLAAAFRLVARRPAMRTPADWRAAAAEAPCEPTNPPYDWPPDPYAGIVNGPQLVDRTRWTHAQHQARYLDVEDTSAEA